MAELFNKLYATYLVLGFAGFIILGFTTMFCDPYSDSKPKTFLFGIGLLMFIGTLIAAFFTSLVAIWVF